MLLAAGAQVGWPAGSGRLTRDVRAEDKRPASETLYRFERGFPTPMVDQGPMKLKPEGKALIMEQVLIGIYEPKGNRA
jgi:hypothetical protein